MVRCWHADSARRLGPISSRRGRTPFSFFKLHDRGAQDELLGSQRFRRDRPGDTQPWPEPRRRVHIQGPAAAVAVEASPKASRSTRGRPRARVVQGSRCIRGGRAQSGDSRCPSDAQAHPQIPVGAVVRTPRSADADADGCPAPRVGRPDIDVRTEASVLPMGHPPSSA